MNTMKIGRGILLASVLLSLLGTSSHAHDFTVRTPSGNVLYMSVKDPDKHTLELSACSKPGDAKVRTGVIEIPGRVQYKKVIYRVVSIGKGAFGSDDKVEKLILPSSVRSIEAGAFEGCSSLTGVVFPGDEVTIGEGAFKGCTALSAVSFGNEWKKIEFKEFGDCEALSEVYIPASVRQISNLKRLPSLRTVVVDRNNPYYKFEDGLLYNADGSILYFCPRTAEGTVVVAEGVTTIMGGAFGECTSVERVDLPTTLTTMSFLEFASCTALHQIVFHRTAPIKTAKYEGVEVFTLKLPSASTIVRVPGNSVVTYRDAVCSRKGEYTTLEDTLPESFREETFLVESKVRRLM